MKQIIAIVKPFLAEKVLERLKRAPLEAILIREVKGFGRQKSDLDDYREGEFSKVFLPKVEFSMWVDDARCEEILKIVTDTAMTGRIGDGKIFVIPSDNSERTVEF